MQDSLGRDISYLRLSVTDKCNCRCVYCMPAEGVAHHMHGEVLSFEEMREIVEAATELGVRKVRITGGEPLVRRGILDLVRMIAEVPGVEDLAMTTNATLLAPVAGELRRAGLNRLNISLDTLKPERYGHITRIGELSQALAGIEAARAEGFQDLKINCVLMGGVNDDEICDFVRLAKENPYEVRFIELMPMGECADWPSERFISGDAVLAAVPELERLGASGVAELYAGPGYLGLVGLIRAVSHRFCSGCDRIRVTADGRLKPCLHSEAEVALRGLHGGELVEALRAGISAKPANHNLAPGKSASATPRSMFEIGG
jgi:GTP 3',8-cyclase